MILFFFFCEWNCTIYHITCRSLNLPEPKKKVEVWCKRIINIYDISVFFRGLEQNNNGSNIDSCHLFVADRPLSQCQNKKEVLNRRKNTVEHKMLVFVTAFVSFIKKCWCSFSMLFYGPCCVCQIWFSYIFFFLLIWSTKSVKWNKSISDHARQPRQKKYIMHTFTQWI